MVEGVILMKVNLVEGEVVIDDFGDKMAPEVGNQEFQQNQDRRQ